MNPRDIINSESPESILIELLNRLHSDGPVNQEDLETLSYLKYFHFETFKYSEKKLMFLLGLFYKTEEPEDLLSLSYSIFSDTIYEETGRRFSPVQASMRNRILENKYFSFSAPTSAGKSYLFRELIIDATDDIIIVVPSRALIAEYMLIVREMFVDKKDVLILQFIDDVNKLRTSRRVFIVTPERASELFKRPEHYSPSLFLYDEAQISEERIRGTTFDAFVRRADRTFPNSRKVFAHPFIDNPEAQLIKHGFEESVDSYSYKQNTVGKIFLGYNNGVFECFSPFIEGAHLKDNKAIYEEDIVVKKLLEKNSSILIYITKESIYNKSFIEDFNEYISLCPPITDSRAIHIIDEIEDLIGAGDKHSELISLMRNGIVIHHGSIPLNVRFLIEEFTKSRFAKICFATSTLVQGVNMPFDIVWIENVRFTGSEENKTLGLKNLIGRAGRTTPINNQFDYGFVIVRNIKGFIDRFNHSFELSELSQLEIETKDVSDDLSEFIEAVKSNDINDEYNLPNPKANRLKSDAAFNLIEVILNFLYIEGRIMTASEYRELSKTKKRLLKDSFAGVFEISLGRNLYTGERTVLSASITILLWQIQGKSFKELLGLRYSYLTKQKEQRRLKREERQGIITKEVCQNTINNLPIEYSVIPHSLPNSSLRSRLPSRFARLRMENLNYDLIVYDTYDFLDKVISFSLADIFISAFDQFHKETFDSRAEQMVKYLRYGTNEDTEIWLLRYGFSIEEAELIKNHVSSIDEDEIVFSENIYNSQNSSIRSMVEHYL